MTAGAKITGISAALVRGAAISGVVRFRGRTGPPLGGICVVATGEGGVLGIQSEVSTHSAGTYRITSLGTGKYQVQFAPGKGCPNNGNYLAATYHRAVSATDGNTTGNINGYLKPGGVIEGVITDPASSPLDGICVSVSASRASGQTSSGPDGSYSITQLPPASYSVSFTGGCGASGSYAPQVYDGQVNTAAASPVVIARDGQVRSGINARMLPGGSVGGLVTSQSGAKLSNVCVGLASPELNAGLGREPAGRAPDHPVVRCLCPGLRRQLRDRQSPGWPLPGRVLQLRAAQSVRLAVVQVAARADHRGPDLGERGRADHGSQRSTGPAAARSAAW